MSKDKLTDYDATASNNTDVGGVSVAEGMLPSAVNNAIREQMSHLKDFAAGTIGIDVLSLADDDASHAIKLQAPSAVTADTTFTLPDGDGTADQVLKTDGSGQLGFADRHSNPSLIINGAMNVSQRGTSFTGITSTIAYRMDRWQVGFGAAGSNYSITQATDAPDNFNHSMKWQRTASNAVTNSIWFSQAFESINSKVVAGKTCTLSYYAKKGADYSATSSDIQVRIISGTGTDESATSAITAGWAGYAAPLSTTQVITTGWVRYTHSVTFASNVNQISVNLASNSAGTAGADDSLYITGVKLEVGSTATPFEHEDFGTTLAKCQRYFQKSYDYGTAVGAVTTVSAMFHRHTAGSAVSNRTPTITFPVEMRAATTTVVYSLNGTGAAASDCGTGFTHSSDITSTTFSGTDGTHGLSRLGLGTGADDIIGFHYTADAEL